MTSSKDKFKGWGNFRLMKRRWGDIRLMERVEVVLDL